MEASSLSSFLITLKVRKAFQWELHLKEQRELQNNHGATRVQTHGRYDFVTFQFKFQQLPSGIYEVCIMNEDKTAQFNLPEGSSYPFQRGKESPGRRNNPPTLPEPGTIRLLPHRARMDPSSLYPTEFFLHLFLPPATCSRLLRQGSPSYCSSIVFLSFHNCQNKESG